MNLVLSLFPGIGLLDMAFEEEGFCVVRGPDLLWGGDVRKFHPPAGRFDGVIGGPPCQAFSRLRFLVEANGYKTAPNLIPEFERVIDEAHPSWFVMENVPGAPLPRQATGSAVVRDVDCGGETSRKRVISFGGVSLLLPAVTSVPAPRQAVLASGGGRRGPVALGGSGKRKVMANELGYETVEYLREARAGQGLPADFLDDAPFTVAGKIKAIGNGVPRPMGRAIARAVRRALGMEQAA